MSAEWQWIASVIWMEVLLLLMLSNALFILKLLQKKTQIQINTQWSFLVWLQFFEYSAESCLRHDNFYILSLFWDKHINWYILTPTINYKQFGANVSSLSYFCQWRCFESVSRKFHPRHFTLKGFSIGFIFSWYIWEGQQQRAGSLSLSHHIVI